MPVLDMREKVTPNEPGDETVEKPEEEAATEEVEEDAKGDEAEDESEGEDAEDESEESSTSTEEEEEGDGKPEVKPKVEPKPELTELEREQIALQAIKDEKARVLADVVDLKKDRRELRSSPQKPAEKVIVDAVDDLSDLDEASVKLVDRVLKSKGYVKKDDLDAREYHSTVKSEQDAWLDEHPEYKPENDPNDEKWNKFSAIVKMFTQPATPKETRRIMDMAHRELNPNSPPALQTKTKASIDAGKQKIKAAGTSSGGGASKSAKAASSGKRDLSGLQGFTPEELAELEAD